MCHSLNGMTFMTRSARGARGDAYIVLMVESIGSKR